MVLDCPLDRVHVFLNRNPFFVLDLFSFLMFPFVLLRPIDIGLLLRIYFLLFYWLVVNRRVTVVAMFRVERGPGVVFFEYRVLVVVANDHFGVWLVSLFSDYRDALLYLFVLFVVFLPTALFRFGLYVWGLLVSFFGLV